MPSRRRAVFLDKDGTLIHDVPFNVDPSRIRLVDRATEALTLLGRRSLQTSPVSLWATSTSPRWNGHGQRWPPRWLFPASTWTAFTFAPIPPKTPVTAGNLAPACCGEPPGNTRSI